MTDTHYVRAFAARAICGAIGAHSDTPTCARCLTEIHNEDCARYTAYRATAIKRFDAEFERLIVLMPADIAAALDQPYATAPCLDSSTANCVASEFDAARCRSCRRELK